MLDIVFSFCKQIQKGRLRVEGYRNILTSRDSIQTISPQQFIPLENSLPTFCPLEIYKFDTTRFMNYKRSLFWSISIEIKQCVELWWLEALQMSKTSSCRQCFVNVSYCHDCWHCLYVCMYLCKSACIYVYSSLYSQDIHADRVQQIQIYVKLERYTFKRTSRQTATYWNNS